MGEQTSKPRGDERVLRVHAAAVLYAFSLGPGPGAGVRRLATHNMWRSQGSTECHSGLLKAYLGMPLLVCLTMSSAGLLVEVVLETPGKYHLVSLWLCGLCTPPTVCLSVGL